MNAGLIPVRVIDVGGTHELATVELMRAEGYAQRLGVDIRRTYVTNGAEAVDLLLAGKADIAVQAGFGPALTAIAKEAPLRVVAASNLLTVHAVYSRKPDIRRLEDLAGRTVGVGKLGALTHQLIFAALRKHDIDPASVRFVSIGNSGTIFKALLRGEVDAGFGETEVFDNQQHYGVHALEDGVLWRELPDFPNQASFAPCAVIREKRDALTRTLAAYALLYRRLHSPASWDAYAAAWTTALPDSGIEEGRSQWRFYQDNHPFAEDLLLPEVQLRYLQELNISMHLQRSALPFEVVADMSMARDALRLLDAMEPHNQEKAAS
ncbi:ABC transporter substrate-binding protein [Pararobbsia silviterrae]|nr:ABC transporter substrate-binding protein [Pararobbsia silviterrae]